MPTEPQTEAGRALRDWLAPQPTGSRELAEADRLVLAIEAEARASLTAAVKAVVADHEPCCVTIDGAFDPAAHRYAHIESPDTYYTEGRCYACHKPWPCLGGEVRAVLAQTKKENNDVP
jgi:hypothetical protein